MFRSLVLLACFSRAAWAEVDYRLEFTTMMLGRHAPGVAASPSELRFVQLAALRTQDTGVEGLAIESSLWGEVIAIKVNESDPLLTGDVNLLFVDYRPTTRHALAGLHLRFGRQLIETSPATLDQMDGLRASYRFQRLNLQLQLHGGFASARRFRVDPWPIEQVEHNLAGDWIVGAQLRTGYGDVFRLGLAYHQRREHTLLAVHDAGWDLTLAPLSWLEFFTRGALDLTTLRLKELRALLQLRPKRYLDLAAGYEVVAPDLFLSRSSIFAVFNQEQHQRLFLAAELRPNRSWLIEAEAGAVITDSVCTSGTMDGAWCRGAELIPGGRLRVILRFGQALVQRLVLELERRGAEKGGYTLSRLAGSYRLGAGWLLTAALQVYRLDQEPTDEQSVYAAARALWSVTGTANLAYQIRPGLDLLGGGSLFHTPQFPGAGSFMARLVWSLEPSTGTRAAKQ
jgi:hypothetical protein